MPDIDQSEAFDEDNSDASETGGVTNEFKTFEEMPDVLDVTTADGVYHGEPTHLLKRPNPHA